MTLVRASSWRSRRSSPSEGERLLRSASPDRNEKAWSVSQMVLEAAGLNHRDRRMVRYRIDWDFQAWLRISVELLWSDEVLRMSR